MIEAKALHKRYGALRAVDGISFAVAKGEVLGFLGPNGAGKSTTMRIVTGYIQADRGTVTIGGYDIQEQATAAKALIGYLPENAPLYGDMKVEDFLRFAAGMRGLYGRARRQAVDRAIATCFLGPVRRQSIETLSKGYRHRTCFAQALLHDPDVLIMDEPTDGLDPNQKHEMRKLIREMGQRKAIIISTHILEEADAVCSRVAIIARGRMIFNGLPDELRAQSPEAGAVDVTIRGLPKPEVLARLGEVAGVARVRLLAEAGDTVSVRAYPAANAANLATAVHEACVRSRWTVTELRRERGRLDEVFRQLTHGESGTEQPSPEPAATPAGQEA